MITAIFDLDGTLYTGQLTRGIVRHHRAHRVKRVPLYIFMATHMPLWWLQRAGLVSKETLNRQWARHLGWTVRGWTPQEAARAFTWIAEHYVAPLVRPDVLGRLQAHRADGHRVIMVSGTFAPLLSVIGQRLGIKETVGTPLVIRDGRYTGAAERPVCQGAGKVRRLRAFLDDDPVHWSQSYAYADSWTDIPLLEQVGHPVAVYPDAELKEHARRQGWEIMNTAAAQPVCKETKNE